MHRGQRRALSSVLHCHSLCYSSETVSLVRSGVRMAATKPQQSSCAHPSWCQGYRSIRQHPAFYMSSGGFELRASCLSPKVSPEFFSFISLLHTGPLPTFPLFTFSFPFFFIVLETKPRAPSTILGKSCHWTTVSGYNFKFFFLRKWGLIWFLCDKQSWYVIEPTRSESGPLPETRVLCLLGSGMTVKALFDAVFL